MLNKLKDIFVHTIRFLAKCYSLFNKQKQEIHLTIDYQNQEASNYIRDMLQNQKPCLICRFGSVELSAVLATYNNQTYNLLNNSIAFIQGKRFFFWLSPYIVDNMIINAGFFPEDKKLLFKYGNLVLSDLPQIDILGSWINFEHYIAHLLANSIIIPLKDLETIQKIRQNILNTMLQKAKQLYPNLKT